MNVSCTVLAAAVALVAHGAAMAQVSAAPERPWYVGVSQEFTRESNVLGSSSGEVSDTISTTSLRGGLNQPFGRQRLFGNVTLSHQRYKDLSERDNNGYVLDLGLDWSTVERLSGSVVLNSQRRQSDFNVGVVAPVTLSNIERSDDLDVRVRLGVVTMLAFEAGAGHRRVTFSAPEYAAREYKQDSANLGVVYRPSAILSLSTGVSGADTRYQSPDVGQTQADRNKRRDIYVGANWVPTGASTIDARVLFGKLEYDQATAADFEGVTGSLSWAWRPSGRLGLTTTLIRDSGLEAGFQRSADSTQTSATDFSRITNRIALAATYELTGKIGLTAGVSHARRDLVNSATGATGRDNTTAASLGARWAATRTINVSCQISRESRSASGVGSSDLENDRIGCVGALTID